MKVWKYQLNQLGEQEISMPKGAEILTAQSQHESVCMWVKVDPYASLEPRTIEVVMTGVEYHDEQRTFIGTVQLKNGIVLHVFELTSVKQGGEQ